MRACPSAYDDGVDPKAIEARLEEFFRKAPAHITTAWLFGSVARGSAGDLSDVDVAVLSSAEPTGTLQDYEFELGWTSRSSLAGGSTWSCWIARPSISFTE